MSTAWWVQLGGYLPASKIASHTMPVMETAADGGCISASFTLNLTQRSQHQLLAKRTLCRIMCGSAPVFTGLLGDADRNTWEVHASGMSVSLNDYYALDADGNSTRNVEVAINRAIATGWKGRNPFRVGASTTVPGDVGAPITVAKLLDELCEWYPGGLRWGCDRLGNLYTRAPGVTEPRWMTMPGAAAFGVTDENAATRLIGRYFNGSTYQNAYAGSGAPEQVEDLTDRGTLTEAQATQILAGKLARKGTVGWTNGVTLDRNQMRTLGNVPANLAMIRGGQTLRAHGLAYTGSQHLFQDVELGKTKYQAGATSIYVEPHNKAVRDAIGAWAS